MAIKLTVTTAEYELIQNALANNGYDYPEDELSPYYKEEMKEAKSHNAKLDKLQNKLEEQRG